MCVCVFPIIMGGGLRFIFTFSYFVPWNRAISSLTKKKDRTPPPKKKINKKIKKIDK